MFTCSGDSVSDCDMWFYLQSWYLTKSIIFPSRRHLSYLSLLLGFPLSIFRIQSDLKEHRDLIFFIQKFHFVMSFCPLVSTIFCTCRHYEQRLRSRSNCNCSEAIVKSFCLMIERSFTRHTMNKLSEHLCILSTSRISRAAFLNTNSEDYFNQTFL